MAPKRARRRQDRRRQHQAGQARRRRERRARAEAVVERFRAAADGLYELAADPAVPVESVVDRAASLLDDDLLGQAFGEPGGAFRLGVLIAASATAGDDGAARARAVAAAAVARADAIAGAGSSSPLAFLAAGLAATAGDDTEADRLVSAAVDRLDPSDDRRVAGLTVLAQIRKEAGRLGAALELLDPLCADAPDDDVLQDMRADALERSAARLRQGADGEPDGQGSPSPSASDEPAGRSPDDDDAAARALAAFADRSLLYELRRALVSFVAARPDLADWQAAKVASFVADVRSEAGLGPLDELGDGGQLRLSALAGAADGPGGSDGPVGRTMVEAIEAIGAERSLFTGPDDPEQTGDLVDEQDDGLIDDESILGLLADDPATRPELAEAARSWYRHARYGLWQVQPGEPGEVGEVGQPGLDGGPGRWLVDLVTRRRCYVAVPPEQLDGLAPWSVLAGLVVPVGGVWRTGVAVAVLDPLLADRTAELLLWLADEVVAQLARDHRLRAPKPRKPDLDHPRSHGVLAALLDPMDPDQADLTGKVVAQGLPMVLGMLEAASRRGPGLRNTDGEPLELIEASVATLDPAGVRQRLLAQGGFDSDDGDDGDGDDVAPSLSWLGREMTEMETASALASFRAEARRRGLTRVPDEELDGPRHWIRGTVRFLPGWIRVEVNSRARLEAISAALRRAGVTSDPIVERRLDPALDLGIGGAGFSAAIGARSPGDDAEAEAAWRQAWLDDPLPALDGVSPRAAAADMDRRIMLEGFLRQLEHSAGLAAASGADPMDVAAIRSELGMDRGIFGADDEDGDEE